MGAPEVDTGLARYVLLCGHVLEIPAELDDAIEDPLPATPYRWCGTCSCWQQVGPKIAPGSATTTQGE